MVIAPPLTTHVLVLADPPEAALRVLPANVDTMLVGRLGYEREGVGPGAILLSDTSVSAGRHGSFQRDAAGLRVGDFGHDIFLNAEHIYRTPPGGLALHVGDQVQMGRTLFRFEHCIDTGTAWPEGCGRMVEAVLANPSSDAPRLVLADWLCERGHPRGELIMAQIRGGETGRARAAELLAKHQHEWLSPLDVPVESWTFARGFLHSVRVRRGVDISALRRYHPIRVVEHIGWHRFTWERGEIARGNPVAEPG